MNKKTILILVISVIVLSSIGITFYFLNGAGNIPSTTGSQPVGTGGSAFPTSGNIGGGDNTTQNNNQNGNGANTATGSTGGEQAPESASIQINKVSDIAVAGITFVNKNGQNFLRYIEKGTGHIKEMSFDEKIPTDVTNTTITSVFDSFWGKDGESLIFRRLDGLNNTVQTVYGVISTSSETEIKKLDTTLLPQNTLDVAVSPDKNKVFYLVREGENTIGFVSDFNKNGPSNKKIQVWKSPIREWAVSWPSTDNISLLTKPSSGVNGYLYALGTGKGNQFEKIMGGVLGLTAITSPLGDKLIYSETTGTGFLTYQINKKGDGMNIFPVKTIPEKCVFSKINKNILYCGVPGAVISSQYPDSWYQGVISFSDNIYKIDLDVNFAGVIVSREKLGTDEIDVTNPILSDDENYLGFINKKDNTPWIVKIR